MNLTSHLFQSGAIVLLISCAAAAKPPPPSARSPAASTTAPADTRADLAEARRLAGAREFAAARQLYQRCIAQQPNDSEAHFFYGLCLATEAVAVDDPTAAVALRRQARQEMLMAQKLGSQEPLIPFFLDQLKPDGSAPPADTYSVDRQVNVLMTAAEAAYNKGDFTRAANLHEQALTLEPGNYYAALYCGDAYFSAKDYAAAGKWFAKAVAINPDIETAHRYWADALAHQRKFADATAQYIEAIVADPYNRLPRGRFEQYAKAVSLPLRTSPLPLPQATVVIKGGKTQINVNGDQDVHGGALGLAYAVACAKFRTEDFARLYSKEKAPRRSLPEEVEGLRTVLQVAKELREAKLDKIKPEDLARWRPSLETLSQIQNDGLLEAFALLERADQELAQDYASYRAAHRDKLIRFIRVYWCSLN